MNSKITYQLRCAPDSPVAAWKSSEHAEAPDVPPLRINHISCSNIPGTLYPLGAFHSEGDIVMTAFNRAKEPRRNDILGIPARKTNTPAWIASIGVLAVIVIGAYGYESGMWGSHESVAPAPTHEMTQPPPVNPAPPPEPAKP
jgi:hypothetical protein